MDDASHIRQSRDDRTKPMPTPAGGFDHGMEETEWKPLTKANLNGFEDAPHELQVAIVEYAKLLSIQRFFHQLDVSIDREKGLAVYFAKKTLAVGEEAFEAIFHSFSENLEDIKIIRRDTDSIILSRKRDDGGSLLVMSVVFRRNAGLAEFYLDFVDCFEMVETLPQKETLVAFASFFLEDIFSGNSSSHQQNLRLAI